MGLTLSEQEGHLEVKGPKGGSALLSRGQWLLLLLRNLLTVPRKVVLVTLAETTPHINSAVLKDHLAKASFFSALTFFIAVSFYRP